MGGVELASVVRQLRAELNEALADAAGERLRFELGPLEMSLRVTVGEEATPGAKVRFWVIEAGAMQFPPPADNLRLWCRLGPARCRGVCTALRPR